MKLTQNDKFVEETLRNISGETIDQIDAILKSLMFYTLMQYSEGEMIRLPYFGAFKIIYKGDVVTEEGRVADLETLYFPSNDVKLNIGMLEDIKNNGGEISSLPVIKDIIRETKAQLNCVINDTI